MFGEDFLHVNYMNAKEGRNVPVMHDTMYYGFMSKVRMFEFPME